MHKPESIYKSKIYFDDIESKCIEMSEHHYDCDSYYTGEVSFLNEFNIEIQSHDAFLYTTKYAYNTWENQHIFSKFHKYIWLSKFKIDKLHENNQVDLTFLEGEVFSQDAEIVFDIYELDYTYYSEKELNLIQSFFDHSVDFLDEEVIEYFKNLKILDKRLRVFVDERISKNPG